MNPHDVDALFSKIECINEHVGSLRAYYRLTGNVQPKLGSPGYHIVALEAYAAQMFQVAARLFPEALQEESA